VPCQHLFDFTQLFFHILIEWIQDMVVNGDGDAPVSKGTYNINGRQKRMACKAVGVLSQLKHIHLPELFPGVMRH